MESNNNDNNIINVIYSDNDDGEGEGDNKSMNYSKEEENCLEIECDLALEKELKEQCDLSIYINKLELDNRPDSDLYHLSKEEIIEYKNYQILKLKAYIASLEKEKEDLINEYKVTSEKLLERIKDLEFKNLGFRPETPMIAHNINDKKKGVTSNNFSSINNNQSNSISNTIKQRCPNCAKDIPQTEFFEHSLDCLRKTYHCMKCDELMNDNLKQKHFDKFKDINSIIKSIHDNDYSYFKKAIDHGYHINQMINSQHKESIIHLICRKNNIDMLNYIIDQKDCELNKENIAKETPLIIAIEHKSQKCAKALILKGAKIKQRNNSDYSPLMICCKYGYESLVRLLIQKGSDINEKNILGETPLKISQMNNHESLALMLINEFKANISS